MNITLKVNFSRCTGALLNLGANALTSISVAACWLCASLLGMGMLCPNA